MKQNWLARSMWPMLLILLVTPILAISETGGLSLPAMPEAYVPVPDFAFSPVLEGAIVTHDFIIQNRGKAPLIIISVETGCGCTTAEFSKAIDPGGQGHIRINGNTMHYGGRNFSRNITVNTNDPERQRIDLTFSGEVDVFALIDPKSLLLKGKEGETVQGQVTIVPNLKYPFTVIESMADPELAEKVSFTLDNREGIYILTVKNLMKEPGQYRGNIHLKTDNDGWPEISIFVVGQLQARKTR